MEDILTINAKGNDPLPSQKKPPVDPARISFRRLSPECERGAFSCGFTFLDNWFKHSAQVFHEQLSARVVTAHLDGQQEPIGYYGMTLQAEHQSLFTENKGFTVDRKFAFTESRMMVCRVKNFAVSKEVQGMGIGTEMMGHAIDNFFEVVERTGAYGLILQSLDTKTKDFYYKLGFADYGDEASRRMILPALGVIEYRKQLGL